MAGFEDDRIVFNIFLPQPLDQIEVLLQQAGGVLIVHAKADHLFRRGAAADAHQQAAFGELIQQVNALGEAHRVVQRDGSHRHAEMDLFQLAGQVGGEDKRIAGHRRIAGEVMVWHKDRIEAAIFSLARMFDQRLHDKTILLGGGGTADEENRETHSNSWVVWWLLLLNRTRIMILVVYQRMKMTAITLLSHRRRGSRVGNLQRGR